MKYVMMRSGEMRAAILLLGFLAIAGCHGDGKVDSDAHLSSFIADMWLEGADVIRILWRDCSKKLIDVKDVIDHKEYFPKFVRCMKRKTLRALDRSLSTDIVPVTDGINLVRYEMVDKSGNIMSDNETSAWTEAEMEEGEWRSLALQRMAKVLRTHVVKFDFDQEGKATEKVEYRGRRRHQMMTMMMFGIVSIGMVLIPMGFQFLAVLGGKALLLAKMALILASIQGLKKVSSGDEYHEYHSHGHERPKIGASPLNYGFYQSYPPYEHYEKRSSDWPEPSVMPGTPPPSMPRHNLWPTIDTASGNSKYDRLSELSRETRDALKDLVKPKNSDSRQYPVYTPETSSATFITSIDSPTPLADLTTRPGDVQADYSFELPYNGFRFQSPTPVVSA